MWNFFFSTIVLLVIRGDLAHGGQPYVDDNQSKEEVASFRSLQSGIPYKVELLLALDSLNDTVATEFETSETIPSTNASIHFCYAVNTQSSGNQVAFSAAAIGATIQTSYVNIDSTGADSQCFILGTNRNYDVGYNVTAAGLFRLELAIGQIVYVQSNSTTLTLAEITAIVETGFSRGLGGRLRFRSLLVTNLYFYTVVNIEVLDSISIPTGLPIHVATPSPNLNPYTVTPQRTPSMKPSSFPMIEPTGKPSTLFSSAPTTTINPSPSPTSAPSTNPQNPPNGKGNQTSYPTFHPAPVPSVVPSPLTSAPLSDPSLTPSTQPKPSPTPSLVVPLPPSTTQLDDDKAIIIGTIVGIIGFVLATLFLVFCICYPFCFGRKDGDFHDPDNASGSFPGHQSTLTPSTQVMTVPGILTLDEDAQSLANTTLDGKSSAPIFNSNQSSGSPRRIQINESFDESSIYTSTSGPSTLISNDAPQLSPRSNTDKYDGNIEHGADDLNVANLMTIPSLQSPPEQNHVPTQNFGSVNSEAHEFDPFDDENEHFADDESSFEFGNSMALSDPSFATLSVTPAVSLKSDETKLVQNRNPDTAQQSPSLSHHELIEVSEAFQNGHRHMNQENYRKNDDKTTLEQFLHNSQATPTFSTSKSVSSLHSAPSRLVIQRPIRGPKTAPSLYGRPPQHGNRRVHNYNMAPLQTNRLSASSVGPSFRSRFRHNPSRVFNGLNHEHKESNTELGSNSNSAFRSQHYSTQASISSGLEDPFLNEYVGLQTPSTDTNPPVTEFYHALPRQSMSVASYRDEIDSPTMHSSHYGNYSSASSMYDSSSASGRSGSWLIDADEHTLDSDPRIGSLQSTSSRSSRMASRRETKSDHDRINHVKAGIARQNRIEMANGASNRSTMDEQKSADQAAGPYSWQSALGTYGASSISSSSTAGSGSRSTLSSRVDANYKEQYEVLAPPGKINIVLVADFHNGSGTVISKVRATSALQGKLCEGDELVAIDGDDVTNMVIAEITAMMASRAGRERKLTVLRDPSSPSVRHLHTHQETKHDSNM